MKYPPGHLIRVHPRSKNPVGNDWNDAEKNPPLTPEQADAWISRQGGNLGLLLQPDQLVIDFDFHNPPEREWSEDKKWQRVLEVCKALDIAPERCPIVRTGGGGWHIYLVLPPDCREILHTLPQFPGAEFRNSGQVLLPGSIHSNGTPYECDLISADFPAPFASETLCTLIRKLETASTNAGTGEWTEEQLAEYLLRVDVLYFRKRHDAWLAFMAACHEVTAGSGKDAFVRWCVADELYAKDEEAIRYRWTTFTAGQKDNAGIGTLVHVLNEHGGIFDLDFRKPEDEPWPVNEPVKLPSTAKPTIRIRGGSLSANVRTAEHVQGHATLRDPVTGIFQRGGFLVRLARYGKTDPEDAPVRRSKGMLQILTVGPDVLRMTLTDIAEWQTFDNRSKEWKRINAPHDIAQTLVEAAGLWPTIPALEGIHESPVMRPDGTVLDVPGYDTKSESFLDPGRTIFPAIKDKPSKDEARRALDHFRDLLKGFPFVTGASLSVALSMLFTPLVRFSVRAAPMFIVSAPKMGSGKTLLSNLPGYLATGRAPGMISQSGSPEEERKRLLALLLEGSVVTVIDNIERPLKSDALCTALTEPTMKDRVLGHTKTATVPTTTTWIGTGNNVRVDGDLTSRCLLCSLDPECERPEERSFDVNLHEFVPRNRGELVAAALTVLRAYVVSGERVNASVYGRFEAWSRFVREPLLWLGCDDPCETRKAIEINDPVRGMLGNLLAAWYRAYGETPKTVADVIGNVQADLERQFAELETAIKTIAEEGARINAYRLANFIARHERRIERGFRFERCGERQGTNQWRVLNPRGTEDGS